jgi:TonB family protein
MPQAAGGFGDATVTRAPSATSAHWITNSSATAVAEILDKPRPAYTSEARRLRIEGEVLLDVLFQASGETKVLRILRGLGHGLDESATAAACQIHFRPAQRDGMAIDSSAVVHIVFQLAN